MLRFELQVPTVRCWFAGFLPYANKVFALLDVTRAINT
jgi:hypothetical protein